MRINLQIGDSGSPLYARLATVRKPGERAELLRQLAGYGLLVERQMLAGGGEAALALGAPAAKSGEPKETKVEATPASGGSVLDQLQHGAEALAGILEFEGQ